MLRFLNIIAVLLAGACAFFLYSMKFETRMLERETAALTKTIKDERRSIAVLKAEWSHLTRPERVERLARKHLGLQPLQVYQMSDLKDLPTPQSANHASPDPADPLGLTGKK
ncbi:MAG: cell division protein FtsL [Methyloligellaceae bacterium]